MADSDIPCDVGRAEPGSWLLGVLRGTLIIVLWLFFVTLGHRFRHLLAPTELTGHLQTGLVLVAATAWLTAATYVCARLLPRRRRPGRRALLLILLWMALLSIGHALSHTGADDLALFLENVQTMFGGFGFLLFVVLYAALLALPFFPGVEIGLAIMAMFGASGAIGSYLATVLGLSVAFLVGRTLPTRWRERLGMYAGQTAEDAAKSAEHADETLSDLLPPAVSRFLARCRYPTLALALNFPGNAAIGGGGGVALLCGMSPLFKFRWFVSTVAIAVAPIPLLFIVGVIDAGTLMKYRGSLHDFLVALEPIFLLR